MGGCPALSEAPVPLTLETRVRVDSSEVHGGTPLRRIGWTIAVIAVAIGTGLYLSRKPWAELREQRALSRDASDEMKRVEAERADLARQESRLKNPAGREALARERGYRKPGEVPVEDLK
ncbi:MAG: hypothetical protein JSS66_16250 [Armatimonadetes bacterium]|nr:hypothetical protein [Armatimonadota bacterium]